MMMTHDPKSPGLVAATTAAITLMILAGASTAITGCGGAGNSDSYVIASTGTAGSGLPASAGPGGGAEGGEDPAGPPTEVGYTICVPTTCGPLTMPPDDTDSTPEGQTNNGATSEAEAGSSISTATTGPDPDTEPQDPSMTPGSVSESGINASDSTTAGTVGSAAATGGESTAGDSSTGDPEPVCGNGVLEPGEECDDHDKGFDSIDGCSPTCKRNARFVFATSTLYPGDMLTLESADAECALLGPVLAGYPVLAWRAWLSDFDEDTAAQRIGTSALPYILNNKTKVTGGAEGFSAGVLWAPINRDEAGGLIGFGEVACTETDSLVWTWTLPDGTAGDSCENSPNGLVGIVNDQGVGWTALCSHNCAMSARLYCLEYAVQP